MRASVTYPYRDRETGLVRYLGEEVELAEARFAELSARGFVEQAPPGAAPPEPACSGVGDAAPGHDAAHGPAPSAMTAAQLREAVEAKGGFAPMKATKAQLLAILESL